MPSGRRSPSRKSKTPIENNSSAPACNVDYGQTFAETPFWQKIPAFAKISSETFSDHTWQNKNAITSVKQLREVLSSSVDDSFYEDVNQALKRVPMAMRIPPYVISLMDWKNPYGDPLRIQFLPVFSEILPDHPKLTLDSLGERQDSPVAGLTHRYPDKALFLALDICPIYCRFCTRSYAIGGDTELVKKDHQRPTASRWEKIFDYIRQTPRLEDLVISGGDAYQLRPEQIKLIGETLLAIPHVRRFRFATKGLAVMPMKIVSDDEWFRAIADIVEKGRKLNKEVVIHTHFNHPHEITHFSLKAANRLFQAGVKVRNQSVLIRGVNDDKEAMVSLVKLLSYLNIEPYYVYQHDLVPGVENLRTSLSKAIELEKEIRGITAGFNTPLFIVDLPGGGGKRDVHSYEAYHQETGISVFRSPNTHANQLFYYFDPISSLPPGAKKNWANTKKQQSMLADIIREI